ncbi:MAG: DUF2357 domain-containing protein [Lachnospiraceae bacterium]|nr:DUF2357 domain-containing protein [Lachnospiraceae bacterium]
MVYDDYSDDILKAYGKMTGQEQGNIEDDKYYKYFYNLLETGRNYVKYSYVRLVKEVDETWVNAIEEAMPSLQHVVLNPRKFIEEEREVVNIAMARNITAESVRHLLAHSNYIDEYRKDGTVIPNKILNIYKEESLNTYENRFICTLIAELQFFINKRFDAIFEASKDELGVNFEVDSSIDNYTETIDYSLQIKIRDKQNDTENEFENKDVFARIIQLHRNINMLVGTEFVATMRRFPAVKHPIVKTNAIAKNRDYKACHKLWNFIHSYTQVGFKVDLVKQDPNISQSFEKDIYNSFVWNYAMLHNYMEESDVIDVNRKARKKDLDMQGIRRLLEEIVAGTNIPDENLRKLVNTELKSIQSRRKQEQAAAAKLTKEKQKTAKGKKA